MTKPRSLMLLIALLFIATSLLVLQRSDTHAAPGCGLAQAAFCDTFDAPFPVTSRAGQLSPVWGVSRVSGYQNNGREDAWAITTLQSCNGPQTVSPPNDIVICNGQLRESVDDGGDVAVLAMYPKQPFDFAGRTGTIAFDVANDTGGTHAAWPEVWITDKPVPAPFTHFSSWVSSGQHSVGIRMAHANGFAEGTGVNCAGKWTVDSAVVTRNYIVDDSTEEGSTLQVTPLDCVTFGSAAAMNHVEIRVSQTAIDVYATNAGTVTPLKRIATIPNANLSFTQGLTWIEDAHYNGDKEGPPFQSTHTFVWDNFGFDGPFTYRDASYDVLDALVPSEPGFVNLGWSAPSRAPVVLNTLPLDGVLFPVAQSARLLFNYYSFSSPSTFLFAINGHPHSAPSPYPPQAYTPRTIALDLPLTDLVPGPNNIRLSADVDMFVANVNIVLVNVSGAPSPPIVTPPLVVTATNTSVPQTSTPTRTPIPGTSTPTPTQTPVSPTATLQPASPTATPTQTPVSPSVTPQPASPTPAPGQAQWTMTAAVSDATPDRGSIEAVTVSVKSTAAMTALVDTEIYDLSGHKVFQAYVDNVSFSAGESRIFPSSWSIPADIPRGVYTVKVGIFIPGWGQLYSWNDSAAILRVN